MCVITIVVTHREKEDDSFRKGEKDQSKLYWPCLFFKYRGISVFILHDKILVQVEKKQVWQWLVIWKRIGSNKLVTIYACVHVLVMSTLLGVLSTLLSLLDTKQQIDKGSSKTLRSYYVRSIERNVIEMVILWQRERLGCLSSNKGLIVRHFTWYNILVQVEKKQVWQWLVIWKRIGL